MSLFLNRGFMTLWIGQTVSAFGDPFTSIATAWYVYKLTGSTMALGGMMLAFALPNAFIRLFAGTLVDRMDRKKVMLITDILRTVCMFVVVGLLSAGSAHRWYFYALNVILGTAGAFFDPASFAMVPNLIRKDQLIQANSMMNTTMTASFIVAPGVAGLVVTALGADTAIAVDAVTFALSSLSLFLLPSQVPSEVSQRNFLHDIAEGFRFFGEHRGLLWLLSLAGMSNLCTGMMMPVVLPYSIHVLHAGARGFGLLQTAISIGMLGGSLMAPFFRRFVRRKVMIPAHMFSGVMMGLIFLTHQFWVAGLLTIGIGIGIAIWNAMSSTFYQELVPDNVRGRVQSVRLLLAQGSTPAGLALGPAVATWITVPGVFLVSGCLVFFSGIVAYRRSSLRGLDRLDESRPQAPSLGT